MKSDHQRTRIIEALTQALAGNSQPLVALKAQQQGRRAYTDAEVEQQRQYMATWNDNPVTLADVRRCFGRYDFSAVPNAYCCILPNGWPVWYGTDQTPNVFV